MRCVASTWAVISGCAVALACGLAAGGAFAQSAVEDPFVQTAPLWDADRNGTYTCDEWKQYAGRIFNQADRNHDGYIDATEFKTVQSVAPMFKQADLAYFDDNRDGRLSREEFVNRPNPLFSRYDRNGDCKVTQGELKGDADAPRQGPAGGGRLPFGDR